MNPSEIMLLHGDCLELMRGIPDGSVDMVMTDPPYGTTQCKWDSIIPLDLMWGQLKRITKKNGAIVMTAAQPFTSALVMSNTEMFRYSLVWKKTKPVGHLDAKVRPMRKHEDILVFSAKKSTYNPQGLVEVQPKLITRTNNGVYGKEASNSSIQKFTGYPNSVLEFKSENGKYHPTQKPVALMEYLIKTYTNEGETVLDFTMGSGTTGVACVNTGRNFIGIELDEKYFDIAKGRVAEVEGSRVLPEASKETLTN